MTIKQGQQTGNLAKANRSRKVPPTSEQSKQTQKADKAGKPEPLTLPTRIWRYWQFVWAFLGPVTALTGLWFNLTPVLTIEPSVNIDPSNMYSTQILITNRGHVPIYNMTFACGVGVGGGTTTLNGRMTMPDIRAVTVLHAGEPVTRSCDIGSIKVGGNSRLSFEATFSWPVIGWHETRKAIFEIRKGPEGYFLVPGTLS